MLIAYLDEHKDAGETARWVEQAGRKAASDEASYVSGARIAVTGGKPIL